MIAREDVQRALSAVEPEYRRAHARRTTWRPRERRVPVRGVRRATASMMVSSAFTAPHVTEFLTVDVTPMMELRAKLKNDRALAGGK